MPPVDINLDSMLLGLPVSALPAAISIGNVHINAHVPPGQETKVFVWVNVWNASPFDIAVQVLGTPYVIRGENYNMFYLPLQQPRPQPQPKTRRGKRHRTRVPA